MDDHSSTSNIGRVHSNYFVDEPPPDYEAPPNYDEAIKMYLMKYKDAGIKTDLMNMELDGKLSCYIIIKFIDMFFSIWIFTQFQIIDKHIT